MEYQFINIMTKINEVIFKDINLFFLINKFSKEFIKYIITSLIDFFFKYNQLRLAFKSKDIIAF